MTEPRSAGARRQWYVPTVRNNAIGMLSAGLVMPAAGLTKYYEDLLSLAPARIVLTSSGARPEWFELSEESRSDIPALIELDIAALGEQMTHASATVVGMAGVVPLPRVTGVHFATQAHADEFLARRYDNFHPESVGVAVSPDLFHGDLPSTAEIAEWLESLPEALHPTSDEVQSADALGGAVLMLLASPMLASSEIQVRKAVLERLLSADAATSVSEIVADGLGTAGWLSADTESDRILLRAVVAELAQLSPTTRLGARRVLAAVRRAVEGVESDAIHSNLARIESILKAEAELRPLSDSSGLRVAKALLLFLLRSKPQEAVSWADDMPGDPLAVSGACVFSGLTSGARLLPVSVRRGGVLQVIANAQADRINASSQHALETFVPKGSSSPEVRTYKDGGEVSTSLYLGDVEVGTVREAVGEEQASPPAAPPDGDTGREADSETTDSGVLELVELLRKEDLADPDIARLCATVCRKLGWDDLVVTVVQADENGFHVQGSTVTFPGLPDIRNSIDADEFRAHISMLPALAGPELEALRKALKRGRTGSKRRSAKKRTS